MQSIELNLSLISFLVSKNSNSVFSSNFKKFMFEVNIDVLFISFSLEDFSIFRDTKNNGDGSEKFDVSSSRVLVPVIMGKMHNFLGSSRAFNRERSLMEESLTTLESFHDGSPLLSIMMIVDGANWALVIVKGIFEAWDSVIIVFDTTGNDELFIAKFLARICDKSIIFRINFSNTFLHLINSLSNHIIVSFHDLSRFNDTSTDHGPARLIIVDM
mmetsp:Transcript_1621/g.1449  ORF Transcript_1621/g.1449 Transcript_1621/m.1449 type:complete len:215 (+) Transcript_1621:620-1264(+)